MCWRGTKTEWPYNTDGRLKQVTIRTDLTVLRNFRPKILLLVCMYKIDGDIHAHSHPLTPPYVGVYVWLAVDSKRFNKP
jgi:hypothetical protein